MSGNEQNRSDCVSFTMYFSSGKKKKHRKQPNSKGAFADFRCFPISASVFPELHKMYIYASVYKQFYYLKCVCIINLLRFSSLLLEPAKYCLRLI